MELDRRAVKKIRGHGAAHLYPSIWEALPESPVQTSLAYTMRELSVKGQRGVSVCKYWPRLFAGTLHGWSHFGDPPRVKMVSADAVYRDFSRPGFGRSSREGSVSHCVSQVK